MLSNLRKFRSNPVCLTCHDKLKKTKNNYNPLLPTWIDDNGNTRYDLPSQLLDLREAEKLLICQYLPYIPLLHLKKGQMGMRGHVCCFLQDLEIFCETLPHLPSDINFVRVIKSFKDADGELIKQCFVVRRQKIIDALEWLKRHSAAYRNVKLDFSRLDWIENGVEEMIPTVDIIEESEEVHASLEDTGPSQHQMELNNTNEDVIDATITGSTYTTLGMNSQGDDNVEVSSELKNALNTSNEGKTHTIEWPYVSQKAVSEYGDDINLFPKAFPWLFPGGIGGFHQQFIEKVDVDTWARRMMTYKDGRFARDKYFGFFVHNFCTRKRVQSQGGYYVKGFLEDGLKTLNEIKEDLKNGKTDWVDKITYYSKNLKGSNGYWRAKRQEIYTWINYHVARKRLPPMFFITLSCAEYQWPDIKRLLRERLHIADNDKEFESTSYTSLVNTYTLVIQEYFQKRFSIWMDTVGKKFFKILHHWAKFEFAPTRGQVHVHLLAICDFPAIRRIYADTKNDETRALLLQEWMEKQFLFTTGDETLNFDETYDPKNHPSSKYYTDIPPSERELDKIRLCYYCNKHDCNGYCLRKTKHGKEG